MQIPNHEIANLRLAIMDHELNRINTLSTSVLKSYVNKAYMRCYLKRYNVEFQKDGTVMVQGKAFCRIERQYHDKGRKHIETVPHLVAIN